MPLELLDDRDHAVVPADPQVVPLGEPIRDSTVSRTLCSRDWASSTITNESCRDRPRMWVRGSTSNMSRASTSLITSWEVTADSVS